jgi:hypothetical protein
MPSSLKYRASSNIKNNPTALGDPISLKAETSDIEPTENDRPNPEGQSQKNQSHETMKQKLERNPTALDDSVSLKAEKIDSTPVGDDRVAEQSGYSKRASKL